MQKHSFSTINKIKELRKKGYSILDLVKEFSLPKTTIWYHIRGVKIPEKYIALIKSRQGGSKIRSQKSWQRAEEYSRLILESNMKYPCALFAMLYWAEGNKKGFVFTNTDGYMIKFFLKILRDCFNISKHEIKITIRVFSNLNRGECIDYWSEVTRFSRRNLKIYLNDGGKQGKARYGICRITVIKSGYLYKVITSLIRNIREEVISSSIEAPIAQRIRAVPS